MVSKMLWSYIHLTVSVTLFLTYRNDDTLFTLSFIVTIVLQLLVRWLVGALSPVNHKGLHQG